MDPLEYVEELGIGSQCSREGSGPDRPLTTDRKRPYPCLRCPSRFGSKMELEEHQNSHTGEKPFECDSCKARFNRRSTLWNHKRIHSDKKPFVCRICSMSFKWKNSLMHHNEMHLRKNETGSMDDEQLWQITYAGFGARRKQNDKVKDPIRPNSNVETPAKADGCASPPTLSPEHQKGQDPPPNDPNPNNTPPRLGRQDESILFNNLPLCSNTVISNWDDQTHQQSSSSCSGNEQPGNSTPTDASMVMVHCGTVRNAKKRLRVVEDKPALDISSTRTIVDQLMGMITNKEGKNEELKTSYEQMKKKYDALEEEKRVELEKEKQRADELTANHEQMLVKHQMLEEERDQLENDNRELTERLQQQSVKIAELQQQREEQSCTSQQLKVNVSEMQSSVWRATEQLAQVQEKNAILVTENDVLRQQIRDKDALLDEYRSIDMKAQV